MGKLSSYAVKLCAISESEGKLLLNGKYVKQMSSYALCAIGEKDGKVFC